jgi:hypothetical protein
MKLDRRPCLAQCLRKVVVVIDQVDSLGVVLPIDLIDLFEGHLQSYREAYPNETLPVAFEPASTPMDPA